MRQVDEGKDFVLTRGGLADASSRCIRKKMRSNNELQEVSRGHSTGEKKPGRTEQSLVLSKRRKEVNMKNMRERRVLAVEKSENRTVQICLKGY